MSFLNGRTNRLLLLWSLITFLMVPTTIAQETTAGIQGTVKDKSGAVVSGATIEVTGPALIGVQRATTDSAGAYRLSQLPPGEYTLKFERDGFATIKRTIGVTVGLEIERNVTLQPAGRTETVQSQRSWPFSISASLTLP